MKPQFAQNFTILIVVITTCFLMFNMRTDPKIPVTKIYLQYKIQQENNTKAPKQVTTKQSQLSWIPTTIE